MMRRTSFSSVCGVTVMGPSSMWRRTLPAWTTEPPCAFSALMTSRKVSMPTRSPYSMTTSEPMSRSDIVATASASGVSGDTV
jgi:hypothetical protein